MTQATQHADLSCSFCGKRQPDVKLIAGPKITICSHCVAGCLQGGSRPSRQAPSKVGLLMQVPDHGGLGSSLFPKWRARLRGEALCNFCGRSSPELMQPPSTLGMHAYICRECLGLCQDIIEEQLGSTTR